MRERKVAILRAQKQSMCILSELKESERKMHGLTSALRVEAEEFIPSITVLDIDGLGFSHDQVEVVLHYLQPGVEQLNDSREVALHRHPELAHGGATCRRKLLQGTQSQCELPEIRLTCETKDIDVVATRQCLREPWTAEVLPEPVCTPAVRSVQVFADIPEDRNVVGCGAEGRSIQICVAPGCSMTLQEPRRLFRHPFANKTLRGGDVQGIGEGSELRDNPMFMEGLVKVAATNDRRIKVVGKVRAEPAGKRYHIAGWIEKDGVT